MSAGISRKADPHPFAESRVLMLNAELRLLARMRGNG
jgi:hypothetical protein